MSVREAMLTISDAEFRNWQAYDRISPIGMERLDVLTAMLRATIAQVNGKKGKQYKVSKFMPQWKRKSRTQSPAEMEMILTKVAKAHNNT